MLIKQQSKIHGLGIFTASLIKENEVFYLVSGSIFPFFKEKCAYIGQGKWISDKVLNLINHSCSPNSELIIKDNEIYIKSLKEIKPNKEITLDYNKTEQGNLKIKCNCQSKCCKSYFTITSGS